MIYEVCDPFADVLTKKRDAFATYILATIYFTYVCISIVSKYLKNVEMKTKLEEIQIRYPCCYRKDKNIYEDRHTQITNAPLPFQRQSFGESIEIQSVRIVYNRVYNRQVLEEVAS